MSGRDTQQDGRSPADAGSGQSGFAPSPVPGLGHSETVPNALVQLAERCEKAEGPDRETDKAIVLALKPEAMFQTDDGFDDPIVFHAEPVVGWKQALPAYTASLDAAMTLVPEDAYVRAHFAPDGIGDVIVGGTQGVANTPALALCAAALRARANQ